MSFHDPEAVAGYTDGLLRQVPGLQALHQMAGLLLHEHVPPHGRVLVLGAGGGMELREWALTYPTWRILGIDPSPPMLDLAARTLGPLASGVELLEGYIDSAPVDEFDGAACLLTLHFLSYEERVQTLRELRRRLRPGAPLVVAHHSVPEAARDKALWLRRYANFMTLNGVSVENATRSIEAIASRLPLLSPETEVGLMEQAGFDSPSLFYASLTFKGWVAHACS